ncbi:hypothetical protein HDU92_004830 [Lobulomyces angularis]|nr:hypothetical protein HDU92_004830 [Lobulomyces angularis]
MHSNYVDCQNFVKDCENKSFLVELGASLFAEKNYNLVNISRDLNISYSNEKEINSEKNGGLGVWDGAEWKIRFVDGSSSSWYDGILGKAKMIWRYKMGLFSGKTLAFDLAEKFFHIYDYLNNDNHYLFVEDILSNLNLTWTVESTAKDFFLKKGVNENFVDEIIGGLVRNTYGQYVDKITAFGGLISLYSAVGEVYSSKNGNMNIFKEMLEVSKNVNLKLNSKVITVEKKTESGEFIVTTADNKTTVFDIVVVATPLNKVKFDNIALPIQQVEYVTVHTTIVIGKLNLNYFKLKDYKELPESILIPSSADCPFNSFSIKTWINGTDAALVKFFSPKELEKSLLEQIFVGTQQVYRRSIEAYPKLELKNLNKWKTPFQLTEGLFYVNGMEEWISTMETESLSGFVIFIIEYC